MDDRDPIKRRKAKLMLPKAEHYVHLIYFALVAIHGPYHYAAGLLLVLGILILTLHLEE